MAVFAGPMVRIRLPPAESQRREAKRISGLRRAAVFPARTSAPVIYHQIFKIY